ncbi:DUF58 domain-containing protein [Pseudalkalibacillus caeni]|uniref:DUF58 domain-containing protein n=1 Tax=Exobacillus caeni TaxID=2574798 RepID=A0A5R9F5D1_9BACL|nr:DUF58 domain-containing protein [Pseudalkalibacillus caeni]TLS38241.1 DUF58 domain-containing protein [Pseudalkalibacillus caeni]
MNRLLTPALLQRLSKQKIASRQSVKSMHKGERRSARQGTSLEFSDFRPYVPGDDLRSVDWNTYARTQKHYIKRYLDEQELLITIYLDCSKSMWLKKEKWQKACAIASVLGYISLMNDDRVAFVPVLSNSPAFSYKKGRAYSLRLLQYIEDLKVAEIEGSFSAALTNNVQRKKSLTFIISDFLEPVDQITEAIRKVQSSQKELKLIQVVSKEEIDPSYQGDLKLIDSETAHNENVSVTKRVLDQYIQRVSAHQNAIRKFCHVRGIGFIQLKDTESIEENIFSVMKGQGWIT